MPKRKFNHRKHLITHARDRAIGRYGVKPTPMDYQELAAQVVQGQATLIEDQVLKGIYEVKFRGQKARVVYHRIKRKIITFLPMPMSPEWVRHQTHTKGSPLRHGLPPLIPLDTDFWPIRLDSKLT